MKVAGVIAEYNPFHRGHAYHLEQVRRHFDAVVVVMSSYFTQRGEAAILSPVDRAEMALRCGADAVFALPAPWAVRDAEHFALGGVAILDGLGVDGISFGAETADLPLLRQTAELLEHPTDIMQAALRRQLDSGLPYPAAISRAMAEVHPDAGALLATPNNTLAVCYLRAMMRLKSTMDVLPVTRQGDYHDTTLTEAFPSAMALRGAMMRGDWAGVKQGLPEAAWDVLQSAAQAGRICRPDALDALVIHTLRSLGEKAATLPDVSEGIECRLCASAMKHARREDVLQDAKTKRYPYARLSRMCTHALLHMTDADLLKQELPRSALLLGAGPRFREVMQSLRRKDDFAILGSGSDLRNHAEEWKTEILAGEMWAIGAGQPGGLAFTQGVARGK
ncbi:MAG: nucleotidyltransferase family protein [Clostridiales bacterium]|nr:nucleotidyltransferase family protein [Clostridiales bacterium]